MDGIQRTMAVILQILIWTACVCVGDPSPFEEALQCFKEEVDITISGCNTVLRTHIWVPLCDLDAEYISQVAWALNALGLDITQELGLERPGGANSARRMVTRGPDVSLSGEKDATSAFRRRRLTNSDEPCNLWMKITSVISFEKTGKDDVAYLQRHGWAGDKWDEVTLRLNDKEFKINAEVYSQYLDDGKVVDPPPDYVCERERCRKCSAPIGKDDWECDHILHKCWWRECPEYKDVYESGGRHWKKCKYWC